LAPEDRVYLNCWLRSVGFIPDSRTGKYAEKKKECSLVCGTFFCRDRWARETKQRRGRVASTQRRPPRMNPTSRTTLGHTTPVRAGSCDTVHGWSKKADLGVGGLQISQGAESGNRRRDLRGRKLEQTQSKNSPFPKRESVGDTESVKLAPPPKRIGDRGGVGPARGSTAQQRAAASWAVPQACRTRSSGRPVVTRSAPGAQPTISSLVVAPRGCLLRSHPPISRHTYTLCVLLYLLYFIFFPLKPK